ncbi:PKD domain-containing protein [Bdellovibrio bacteriovorus]|uniref:PKD domain-containing protein n=1 Tax=Bdellovibrio bacteriovorus TaxID=959 RepID=UPI0035A57828
MRFLYAVLIFMCLGLSVSSAEVIYGPEEITTDYPEVLTIEKTISLQGRPPGKYLLKVFNGISGPYKMAECKTLSPETAVRKCLEENVVEKFYNDFSRFESFTFSLNGMKYPGGVVVLRQHAYREVVVNLDREDNIFSFTYQGYRGSSFRYSIESFDPASLMPKSFFTLKQLTGIAPLSVSFFPRESFDPSGDNLSFYWNFGDGTSSSARGIVNHLFETPGIYNVSLRVQNSKGQQNDFTVPVTVLEPQSGAANKAPQVVFNIIRPNPNNRKIIRVVTQGSYDPDGEISKFEIFYGDGTYSIGPVGDHEYAEEGTYVVTVRAYDILNAKSEVEKSVSTVPVAIYETSLMAAGPFYYQGSDQNQNVHTSYFDIPADGIDSIYKITVNNADGASRISYPCSISNYFSCIYDNWQNEKYIKENRVGWAYIYVNDIRISASGDLNQTKATYEAFVRLKDRNKILVQFGGAPTAFMNVSVEKVAPLVDVDAPELLVYGIPEGGEAVTALSLQIQVNDATPVSTEVVVNGVSKFKSGDSYFIYEVPLGEGLNDIAIKSKDFYGNEKVLQLAPITRDSRPPKLTILSPNPSSTFRTNNTVISVTGTSDEPLQYILANGYPLTVGPDRKSFSGTVNVMSGGNRTIVFDAADDLNNTGIAMNPLAVTVDWWSPYVVVEGAKMIHNQLTLPIKITAQDTSPTTISVYVDEVLKFTAPGPALVYEVPLSASQTTKFRVVVVDDLGNTTEKDPYPVDVDLTPPQLSWIFPSTGAVIRQKSFEYEGQATEPLDYVSLGGFVGSAELNNEFKGAFTFLNSGSQQVELVIRDRAGNESRYLMPYDAQFVSDPVAIQPWEYQECPIDQVSL